MLNMSTDDYSNNSLSAINLSAAVSATPRSNDARSWYRRRSLIVVVVITGETYRFSSSTVREQDTREQAAVRNNRENFSFLERDRDVLFRFYPYLNCIRGRSSNILFYLYLRIFRIKKQFHD